MSEIKNRLFEELEANARGPIAAARSQALLVHKTFHNGKENWPNELCVFCAKEVAEIAADHVQGEVNEQVWAEQEREVENV